MRTSILLLPLALSFSTPASAARLKKMVDTELAALVADPGADQGDRVDAADLLLERRAIAHVSVMVGACQPGDVPVVCEHVLAAFEGMKDEPAMAQVELVLMTEGLDDSLRHHAMKILAELDPERTDVRVPELLQGYRGLASGFAADLVAYLPQRDLDQWRDYTLLMATDEEAKRQVRLVALEAAEAFEHPALHDAWLALLRDEDRRVRARCAQNLGRPGLPDPVVRPALIQVVKTDEAGTVRAAAWHSLRFYAGPHLLPLLHGAVLGEQHPVAWGRALELLEPLADPSSIPTLCQLLQRHHNLTADGLIRIIHTMVRIGEPDKLEVTDHDMATALEVLASASPSERIRAEARAAIELLGQPEAQRVQTVAGWEILEVLIVDPTQPAPEPFELGVHLDASGAAVWAHPPGE
jgi:HEAT repeat protein